MSGAVRTADGVAIVVGMTVWIIARTDGFIYQTTVCKDPYQQGDIRHPRLCYSTRRAALTARLEELRAEVRRVEAELAGKGDETP